MPGGGDMPVRDVRNYQPPQGPTNINDSKGPGIHGNNYGNAACPAPRGGEGGRPGIGGDRSDGTNSLAPGQRDNDPPGMNDD